MIYYKIKLIQRYILVEYDEHSLILFNQGYIRLKRRVKRLKRKRAKLNPRIKRLKRKLLKAKIKFNEQIIIEDNIKYLVITDLN